MLGFSFLLLFCFLVWFGDRALSLALLIASMILFPEYIRFDVFVMKMSIARFLTLLILLKYWSESNITIKLYDKWIIGFWLTYVLMTVLSDSNQKHLIYVLGRVMDTVFFYFAARLCLLKRVDVERFVGFLVVIAVGASLLSIIESYSAGSIYTHFRSANTWIWNDKTYEVRLLGLVRAYGATLNPIYWGMSMLLVYILLSSLLVLSHRKYKSVYLFITAGGVFSSLSSGPIMGLFAFILLGRLVKSKHQFKIMLALIVFSILIVEIFSNRHFYDMAQYLTLNSSTAWYRSKLIEVALSNYSIYIVSGVGGNWPNYWGALIDGREIVDVVNQYIKILLNGGLILLIIYLYIYFKQTRDFIITWGREVGAFAEVNRLLVMGLFAIFLTGFTVAFYNPAENLIFLLLGVLRQVAILCKSDCEKKNGDRRG